MAEMMLKNDAIACISQQLLNNNQQQSVSEHTTVSIYFSGICRFDWELMKLGFVALLQAVGLV